MAMRPGANQATGVSQPVALELFHEDIMDAVRGIVSVLGGAKKAGPLLFPDLLDDAAARRLLDCLNPDRQHQLTITQFVLLLKKGRDAGFHGAMHYLTDEVGYTRPSPIDPDDQRAELQRQFVAGVAQLAEMAKRLQR